MVDRADLAGALPMIGAAALVFAIRLIALRRHWAAPTADPAT